MVDYNIQSPLGAALGAAGGLQNLQMGNMRMNQMLQQQQQSEQDAARQQQVTSQAAELFRSGTPQDIAAFSIQNPEMGEILNKQIGYVSEQTKGAMADTLVSALANPDQRQQIIENGAEQIRQMGGNPEVLLKSLDQSPENFEKGSILMLGGLGDKGKSYLSAYGKASRVGKIQQSPHTNIKRTDDGSLIGYNPDTRQYEQIPSPAAAASGSPSVTVNVNEQPEFEKEVQKLNAKAYQDINKTNKQVRAEKNKINRLMSLNEKAFAGGGSGAKLAIGQWARTAGVDVEGLPESEAFRAVSNELVLDKSQQMSGALSDGDMEFLRDTAPNLGNTKEGRETILNYSKDLLNRQEEYNKQARQFRKDNGYFDLGEFETQFQEYADNNPLFPESQQQAQKAKQEQQQYSEGQTATNPQTGEKLIFRGGQWQRM